MRFERGASRHFVIALIGTPEPDFLRQALADVRARSHLRSDFEFKYHWLGSKRLREGVLTALAAADFSAWTNERGCAAVVGRV
jgi:hypothetical protein